MAKSDAASVTEYLDELSTERRDALEAVRGVVLEHLPDGYEEMMDFGMISYVVPLGEYPATYNGHPLMYAALASQKNSYSLYLMSIYGDPGLKAWFTERYRVSGKKMDTGKSCVRFQRLDDLPLDLVGEAIARTPVADFIELYEASRSRVKSK